MQMTVEDPGQQPQPGGVDSCLAGDWPQVGSELGDPASHDADIERAIEASRAVEGVDCVHEDAAGRRGGADHDRDPHPPGRLITLRGAR